MQIQGTVLWIDPPRQARREWTGFGCLRATLLIAVLVPMVIAAVPIVIAMRMLRSGQSGSSFLSAVASHVTGHWVSMRLFGNARDVPVRDVRVRDANGQQYLVRVVGDLSMGNLSAEDAVTLSCVNRKGTYLLRRGVNHTTRSSIVPR